MGARRKAAKASTPQAPVENLTYRCPECGYPQRFVHRPKGEVFCTWCYVVSERRVRCAE